MFRLCSLIVSPDAWNYVIVKLDVFFDGPPAIDDTGVDDADSSDDYVSLVKDTMVTLVAGVFRADSNQDILDSISYGLYTLMLEERKFY